MSKLFGFSGVDDFFPGASVYPKPMESSLLLSLRPNLDVYFPPRKRSRVTAPFVFSGFEQKQTSIEILPDECLFEVFRRLHGGQERSACASVSKRWLNLLSNIHRDELYSCGRNGIVIEDEDLDGEGYLSRNLEGKKATDVRLAAISVGTASRGGLGKLSIRANDQGSRVTDLGLRAIACGCPSLRVLSLWNLSSVGDVGLSEIARGCPLLEKLDLSRCPGITDKGLISIAENCPNLNDLTLESCSRIGNESLHAIARHCPNLKSISIKNCPLIGDQGIAFLLAQTGHSLMKVKFQMLNITDLSLAVVGHYAKSVTDLVLNGLKCVSEKGFWVMGNVQGLQRLKSLSITSCQGVTDNGLEAVGKGCSNLKHFSLSKCPFVSDKGLVCFAKAASSLESLQLVECHRITQFGLFGFLLNCGTKLKAFSIANCLGIKDFDAELPLASSLCGSLKSLTIRNCPGFGDAGLAVLGKLCHQLQDVELCGLHGITDCGVLDILQNSEAGLVKINLSGCVNLTDTVISSVVALHSWTLEVLNLDGCRKITDASLVSVSKNCLSISDLDVSNCAITDFGIQALASSNKTNLQIFSLAGCSMVTDKSLPFVRKLGQTLLGLNIQRCSKISSSTVESLLEQLWRCDILY